MAWVEHRHESAQALAVAVARELAADTRAALATRGQATLALAGGRTPMATYRQLAAEPLDWTKVTALPTDDRCVPHEHPACNLREIRIAMDAAHGLRLEALTSADGEPATSERHARALLHQHPLPFDAVVLGMGNDAHTASLFPGATNLALALDPTSLVDACRIDPDPLPPDAPFPRITLTAARLLRARRIHLLITGQDKHDALHRAQAGRDPLHHPIAALLHAPEAMVRIHWSA